MTAWRRGDEPRDRQSNRKNVTRARDGRSCRHGGSGDGTLGFEATIMVRGIKADVLQGGKDVGSIVIANAAISTDALKRPGKYQSLRACCARCGGYRAEV